VEVHSSLFFASRFLLFSGTYGDVFRVRHRITGEIYALKQIRDEHEANGIPATAMREAAILKQLNHKNIIKLEDIFLTDERCYFLLEYMDEDLKRYLDKHRPLDRRIIKVNKNLMETKICSFSRILCINYSMQFFIVINIELFIEILNHIIF
jgi:serine/threonine protein kinase